MAIVRQVLRSCDRCGTTTDDVEPRKVVRPAAGASGRTASFDACQECRDTIPLSEWEQLIREKRKPGKGKTTRGQLVVSEGEIAKVATPRRTRKKVSR